MTPRRGLACILAAYVMLGLTYDWTTPIFEASDEIWHYPVVRHIAQGKGLPVQRIGEVTAWRQEGSQPPLYYALAAALTYWVNTDDYPTRAVVNPFAKIGIPGTPDNVNFVRHTAAEARPYRGTTLAVHVIRWFSLLLGVGTVALTFLLAERLFPNRPALHLLAAAFVAFNPMFLFISASVNNDNLLVLLMTASLVLVARLVPPAAFDSASAAQPRPVTNRRRTGRQFNEHWPMIGPGVLLGLAALTKISGLVLFPVAALALIARAPGRSSDLQQTSREASPSSRHSPLATRRPPVSLKASLPPITHRSSFIVHSFLIVFGPAVLISGWWYLRNYTLYGEWLGLRTMLAVAGGRPVAPSLAQLASEFPGLWLSYWGVFGAFNVLPGAWVFWLYGGLSLTAVVGGLLTVSRRLRIGRVSASITGHSPFATRSGHSSFAIRHCLLWLFIVLTFLSLARWTSLTMASQGRLMFGAIAPISAYLAAGWLAIIGGRWQARMTVLLGLGLFVIAGIIPFAYIHPAYAPSRPVKEADLPSDLHRVEARFGEGIQLIGYTVDTPDVRPGERADVTLYWRALAPMSQDYNLFLHALGRRQSEVGKIDTWPGGGLLPTSQWQTGSIYPDRYLVPISAGAEAPSLLRLDVGFWEADPVEGLPVFDARGDRIPSVFLNLGRILPGSTQTARYAYADGSTFDGGITLLGYDLPPAVSPDQPISLTLYWQAGAPLETNHTVFVHLDDASGTTVAQADGPPLGGDWPTSVWIPGQSFSDTRILIPPPSFPDGEYKLRVGLYDPTSGVRLAAWDPAGREWPGWASLLSQPVVVK